jgi:F0F1-type ATP synthase membrane subunit a
MADDSVDLKSGPFGVKLSGPNAMTIFLFISLLALAGLTFMEHKKRQEEHAQLNCSIRLSIFIYTMPRGAALDWERMPVDLYPCIPRFLYQRAVEKG